MYIHIHTGLELPGMFNLPPPRSFKSPPSLESFGPPGDSINLPRAKYRLKNYVIVVNDTKIYCLTVIRIDEIVNSITVRAPLAPS